MSTDFGVTATVNPAVRLQLEFPQQQRRLTNFPLLLGTVIRLVLLAPHILVLYYLWPVQFVAYCVSTFGILLTGRYPRGLFKLQVGIIRWTTNISAYYFHLFDEYPPMDLDHRPGRPVTFEVDYPAAPSRWLNFPIVGLFIKLILLLPHIFVLYCLFIVAGLLVFLAQFAIFFSRTFPKGMHTFVVGFHRWSLRVHGTCTVSRTNTLPLASADSWGLATATC